MRDYRIYTVDAEDLDKDFEDITYQDVKDNAIDYLGGSTVEEVLIDFLKGVNNDTVSDIHFHFLVDETEGIILQFK